MMEEWNVEALAEIPLRLEKSGRMEFRIWNLEFGIWNLEFGILEYWNLKFEIYIPVIF
jgi:hypothetical protein